MLIWCITKAKYYLNTELKDDDTEYGGIAYCGETLKEFICDAYGLKLNDATKIDELEMSEVNDKLISCGIQPVYYHFEKERKDFIAMVAMYYGQAYGSDSLKDLRTIVKFAEEYDFDVEEYHGEWLINTEAARNAAYDYAIALARGDKDV